MTYQVTQGTAADLSLLENETIREIVQNVRLIISTMRGSVPLARDFGISPEWTDRPTTVVKAKMIVDIREAVERWEPRVTVKKVTFQDDPSRPGRLIPTVHIEIRGLEADA